jgi:hypothetical protein
MVSRRLGKFMVQRKFFRLKFGAREIEAKNQAFPDFINFRNHVACGGRVAE